MTESIGITKLESIHFYVRDLNRTRKFLYGLDFAEVGGSSAELEARGNQRSRVFEAGDCRYIVSMPVGEGGRAWRYLRQHPEGVGTLVFRVKDAEKALKILESRGGTPISDVQWSEDASGGRLGTFSITTPFGSTTFRFVQRDGYEAPFPGYEAFETPKGGSNKLGFSEIDHITSNFQTMAPALLWMEHVMGFERYWNVEFHTTDVSDSHDAGSGLKSVVMWDPSSGVKFANNEPRRPFFKASQINIFGYDHRGDGVQHAALVIGDIIAGVRKMRSEGIEFMPTPGTYYDALPERISRTGIERIDEDIEILRELEILIDGDKNYQYLLQIFLKDAAGLHRDPEAGPFFFEIIQRKGDKGFGAGNFRALFESIERKQAEEGRI